MRKDLNKVLCERQRIRSSESFARVRNKKEVTGKTKLGVEAWPFVGESTSPFPAKESMKTAYKKPGVWTKDLNENLNPLWGFIRKSVGKNWDNVYSELCKNFDKRKVVNQHILIHLFQKVEINTKMQGGQVVFLNVAWKSSRDGNQWLPIKDAHAEYYVHPVSKVLLRNSERKTYRQVNKEATQERQNDIAQNLVLLSKFNNQNGNGARYAIKINSIWYEISVIKKPDPVRRHRINSKGENEYYMEYPSYSDIYITGAKFKPKELEGINPPFYVSRKTQLSSTNLRKLNLKNG